LSVRLIVDIETVTPSFVTEVSPVSVPAVKVTVVCPLIPIGIARNASSAKAAARIVNLFFIVLNVLMD
jgi:hypothetical protein